MPRSGAAVGEATGSSRNLLIVCRGGEARPQQQGRFLVEAGGPSLVGCGTCHHGLRPGVAPWTRSPRPVDSQPPRLGSRLEA